MAAPATTTSGPSRRPPVAAAISLVRISTTDDLRTSATPARPAPPGWAGPVRSQPMVSSDRVRLVVLFGGRSAEHEVSCTSAAHVLRAADVERYEIVPVGITRDGTWVVADEAVAALEEGQESLPDQLEATGTTVDPLQVVR